MARARTQEPLKETARVRTQEPLMETVRERTQEPFREEATKRKGGEFRKRRKVSERIEGKKRRNMQKAKCKKSTRTGWWSKIGKEVLTKSEVPHGDIMAGMMEKMASSPFAAGTNLLKVHRGEQQWS